MRSLFLKIFLWFWLSVILISSALVVIALITHSNSDKAEWQNQAIVAAEAAQSVDVYEREGAAALKKHFESLPKRPMNAFLFDDQGREVLGNKPPKEAIQLAQSQFSLPALLLGPGSEITESTSPHYMPRPGGSNEQPSGAVPHALPPGAARNLASVKAEQVVGASGRRYTFLVVIPPLSVRTFLTFLGTDELVRLVVGLLLAGMFCLLLARHITAPVMRLRQTANKIAAGDFSARVVTATDKRKDEIGLLSQQFDQMAERVESLLADHKRLLSTVSHELRSPLTRLSVAAALLRQCPEEEKLEYLNRIELETEQLNKLISQLLALSRIESGVDASSRAEIVDLVSLVQEVAADGNFEAHARSCSVAVRALDPCVTTGNADQIRGAVENVVRNAIRHTKTNSEVEISMLRREGAPSAKAVVRVLDHGTGVPEADLKKIFLPFYRVPSPDGPDSDGSGLGLAIVERVARTHGGSVRAINAAEGGLLVELELPLSS